MRSRTRAFLLLPAALLLMSVFVPAQIHGVPASVSSFGFGGNFSSAPGVPASVTSLGPMGFQRSPVVFGNCCFSNFRFAGRATGFSGRHHGFRRGFFPTFVPYAVPYTQVVVVPQGYEQASAYDDEEGEDQGGPTIFDRRGSRRSRLRDRVVEEEVAPAAPTTTVAPATQPVSAQPSTLLVFKDGHQSEVQNYAIVGDSLFNLADSRSYRILLADLDLTATQRANADRGVEFQVPLESR